MTFSIATVLAYLFDPSGSNDLILFKKKKIVDGLIDNRLVKNDEFEDKKDIGSIYVL